MIDRATLVVGFDQKEAIAYHTFCQSVIGNSSIPVQFIPLAKNLLSDYQETHTDGSNSFIYSRFLTPYLCDFSGWAIFADGDMICKSDIKNLWGHKDETKAVHVVKHEYKTKYSEKYLGNKNENYPRKNWSSLMLWNCGHPSNKILTPELISSKDGSFLHRFNWLTDKEIGGLPISWNWLATEYENNNNADLINYTLGTPCFKKYTNSPMSEYWHITNKQLNEGFDK